MTVKELKTMLEEYPEDAEIVVQTDSRYGWNIEDVCTGYGVKSFWGSDYKALVLSCPDQCGAIWSARDLDL